MTLENTNRKKSYNYLTAFLVLVLILYFTIGFRNIENETVRYRPRPVSHMRAGQVGNISMLTNGMTHKPTPSSKLPAHLSKSLSFDEKEKLAVVLYGYENWGGAPPVSLEKCHYNNCIITQNRKNFEHQAAVVFFLPYLQCNLRQPPIKRNPKQVWIFVWLEPSVNLCQQPIYSTKHWKNMINWTMSFEYNADIFLPYGKIYKNDPTKTYKRTFQKKTQMAAWVVSNCNTQSKRGMYVKELQKHGVKIDIFGRCAGKRVNPKAIHDTITEKYKFYLAFESSFCKDYITEKFYHYFQLDVIIVVRGGGNYSKLLPSNAYINAADFKSAKDLATYMLKVANNETLFEQYMANKNKFSATTPTRWGEGFCNICHKLNHLDQNRKTYSNIDEWIHKDKCIKPPDI